jgi:hypothetical protein
MDVRRDSRTRVQGSCSAVRPEEYTSSCAEPTSQPTGATMLLILIPIAIAWLGIATLAVCLCRMAAIGDAQQAIDDAQQESTRAQEPRRAEVAVLEHVRTNKRAGAPSVAGAHRARPATLHRRGVATPR